MTRSTLLGFTCIILFVALGGCSGATNGSSGHVAFFSIDTAQSGEAAEARADFVYFYRNILPWLDEQGLAHSFHTAAPFTIEAARGRPTTFTNDMLGSGRGTILLKQNGARRILHGVYTGVDLISEIQEFLGVGTQGGSAAKNAEGRGADGAGSGM